MVDPSVERGASSSSETAILLAAEKVFVARGFAGARMQEIADAAGINKAMLHYYFRSKQKLFVAVFRSILERTVPPLVEALGSELPLGLKVRRFVAYYTEALDRTPQVAAFILNELNRDPETFDPLIRELAAPLIPVLHRQLLEASSAGRIRLIEPHELVSLLLSLCVFPYVSKPFVQALCGMDAPSYQSFLSMQKASVTAMVFAALQP